MHIVISFFLIKPGFSSCFQPYCFPSYKELQHGRSFTQSNPSPTEVPTTLTLFLLHKHFYFLLPLVSLDPTLCLEHLTTPPLLPPASLSGFLQSFVSASLLLIFTLNLIITWQEVIPYLPRLNQILSTYSYNRSTDITCRVQPKMNMWNPCSKSKTIALDYKASLFFFLLT